VAKYGPVFGFYFGETPTVIIADFSLVRELFKQDSLASRPAFEPLNQARRGWQFLSPENKGRSPGVVFSVGNYWKNLRRFILRNLRDFGFGKSTMEEIFVDEVSKLCKRLDQQHLGEPVDLVSMLLNFLSWRET
jgi:methyl farnesoate epoxidase/farnesoate epoxidase